MSNRDITYPCFVCEGATGSRVRFYAGLNPAANMANLIPYNPGLMGMSIKDMLRQSIRPVEYRVICDACARVMEGQGIPVMRVHYTMLKEERLV